MTIKSNLSLCFVMLLALQNSIAMNPTTNFDLHKAIKEEDIETLKEMSIDFSNRLVEISRIKDSVESFVNAVKSDAQRFELELSKAKGITQDEVQNLSYNNRDFIKLSEEARKAKDTFETNMKPEFKKFKDELSIHITELKNSSLASLIPALEICCCARIPCPGCADSMYRYGELLIGVLNAYLNDPYMELPKEINDIYTRVLKKLQPAQGYTYLPHEIRIGETLSVLERKLPELGADINIKLSDSDISTIIRYASIFSRDGAVGSNVKFFELIERIRAIGNMPIKTLGTCMDEIDRVEAPDELKNIMKMLVLQRIHLQQEHATSSKISEDRKAIFETQADSKSQTENKTIGKLSKDRLGVFTQSKDSSIPDKPAPKKLDMSKFGMFQKS